MRADLLVDKSLQKYNYELIIADDDSPDGTATLSEKLSDKFPIKVLLRKKNKGLSAAVIDGFKIAKGDVLGVMDADGQHPPEIIPRMIDVLEKGEADVVIG